MPIAHLSSRFAPICCVLEPVGELYAKYKEVMNAYASYMAQCVGRLPEGDLNGRALELALQEIERSLR